MQTLVTKIAEKNGNLENRGNIRTRPHKNTSHCNLPTAGSQPIWTITARERE